MDKGHFYNAPSASRQGINKWALESLLGGKRHSDISLSHSQNISIRIDRQVTWK